MQPPNDDILPYAAKGDKSLVRPSRLDRLKSTLERCPYWAMALVFAIISLIAQQRDFPPFRSPDAFWVAVCLFTPGLIRWRTWWGAIISLGAAALAMVLRVHLLDYSYGSSFWFWIHALALAGPIWLCVVAQLAGRPKGELCAFIALCACACAIAVVASGLEDLLWQAGVRWGIPHPFSLYQDFDVATESPIALMAVPLWILIPIVLRRSPKWGVKKSVLASLGIVGISLIVLPLYFYMFKPYAAWRALEGHGPFTAQRSLWVADLDQSDAATERLWRALNAVDWNHDNAHDWDTFGDWREQGIRLLAKRDPHAPERLAGMLLAMPHPLLAEYAAPILSEHKRIETAPILLRYALLNHNKITFAVVSMGVPQAAWALLADTADTNRSFGTTPDPTFDHDEADNLKTLLHVDLGNDFKAWLKFCSTHDLSKIASSLPPEIAAEDSRVYDCIVSYYAVQITLDDLQHKRALALADAAGKRAVLEKLWSLHLAYPYVALNEIDPNATSEVRPFIEQSWREVNVANPDWDVRTTDALEREVQAYKNRVNTLAGKSP